MEKAKKIMNFPGPSAVGRDFMLEKLIEKQSDLEKDLGESFNLKVAIKTTDRPARNIELTKKSISQEQFYEMKEKGEIFASYILESNGKNYGYEVSAFDGGGKDVLLADASVYQTLDLKEKLGESLYSVAVVASRDYREKNIRQRIESGNSSESEEEIKARLNLGDAHVVLLALMAQEPYSNLVDSSFESAVNRFISSKGEDIEAEKFIKNFSNSENVVSMLRRLINTESKVVEEFFVRGDFDRLPDGQPFSGSHLQETLHKIFKKALQTTVN